MIVSGCSSFDYDIKDKKSTGVVSGIRVKNLEKLINNEPNPFQSTQDFRACLFTDFILEGNAFVYFDGVHMYHLPAHLVTIVPDPKTYINKYKYINETEFTPNEVFHFSDVGMRSTYRAVSRLQSSLRTINTLYTMHTYQDNVFKNSCIPGIVLETENTLSKQAKDRTINSWVEEYNAKTGAKKPMIVDNGLKLKFLQNASFAELEFTKSIVEHERKILTALGIPPILLEGGNNANISPNLRLMYLETILPIVNKYTSALERFFGFDISPIQANVSALQPDLKDVAAYHSTLVNAGILTPNEARLELRYTALADLNEVRIPANIAGSAANPSVGGAPKTPDKE